MPSKVQKSATGGREKIVEERADGLVSSGMVSWLHTMMDGVWRGVASNGGEWWTDSMAPMASMDRVDLLASMKA